VPIDFSKKKFPRCPGNTLKRSERGGATYRWLGPHTRPIAIHGENRPSPEYDFKGSFLADREKSFSRSGQKARLKKKGPRATNTFHVGKKSCSHSGEKKNFVVNIQKERDGGRSRDQRGRKAPRRNIRLYEGRTCLSKIPQQQREERVRLDS